MTLSQTYAKPQIKGYGEALETAYSATEPKTAEVVLFGRLVAQNLLRKFPQIILMSQYGAGKGTLAKHLAPFDVKPNSTKMTRKVRSDLLKNIYYSQFAKPRYLGSSPGFGQMEFSSKLKETSSEALEHMNKGEAVPNEISLPIHEALVNEFLHAYDQGAIDGFVGDGVATRDTDQIRSLLKVDHQISLVRQTINPYTAAIRQVSRALVDLHSKTSFTNLYDTNYRVDVAKTDDRVLKYIREEGGHLETLEDVLGKNERSEIFSVDAGTLSPVARVIQLGILMAQKKNHEFAGQIAGDDKFRTALKIISETEDAQMQTNDELVVTNCLYRDNSLVKPRREILENTLNALIILQTKHKNASQATPTDTENWSTLETNLHKAFRPIQEYEAEHKKDWKKS
jgi:hypothetical protein